MQKEEPMYIKIDILTKKIEQMEEESPNSRKEFSRLLGFLAGDKRLTDQVSLSEIAYFVNNMNEILAPFYDDEILIRDISRISPFLYKRRRAI